MPRSEIQKAQVKLLRAEDNLVRLAADYRKTKALKAGAIAGIAATVTAAGAQASAALGSAAPVRAATSVTDDLSALAAAQGAEIVPALANAGREFLNGHQEIQTLAVERGMELLQHVNGQPKGAQMMEALKLLSGLG